MNKITDEMRELLKKPLPLEALKAHPTKNYLTVINPIFVIERLNDVFGVGAWNTENKIISTNENTGFVVVEVTLFIPEFGIKLSNFGGNDNGGMITNKGEIAKNFDLGDAYKGAVTDALTKICSWLEIGIDVYKGKQSHKNAKSFTTEKKEYPKINTPAQSTPSTKKQPSELIIEAFNKCTNEQELTAKYEQIKGFYKDKKVDFIHSWLEETYNEYLDEFVLDELAKKELISHLKI